MTKEIPLYHGKVALVDDEDYERLSQWHWYRDPSSGYVSRNFRIAGKCTRIYLHRFILNAPKGLLVDHRDRDKLNNQKANLRLATKAQNARNATAPKGHNRSSRFKGVTWDKRRQRWHAQLQVNRTHKSIGYFGDEVDAAKARDLAAIKYHGEFAFTNFPAESTNDE